MNDAILTFKKSKRLGLGLLIFWATASILGVAAELTAAEMITIRVRDQVEIENGEVLLGQIASIEGSDTQLVQQLKDIVIGKTPLPGKTRQYDQRHLKMRLKQHHINLEGVNIEGPRRVRISRSHVEIDKRKIEKIVADFIIQNIPQENKTVRIKEINVSERVVLSKGSITYKVGHRGCDS